jgi:hypothetical protein
MDSIRAPLLPLERFDPPGAQLLSRGMEDDAQAPVLTSPEPATATAANRFGGDGADVLALAGAYRISEELDAITTSAVSSVIDHLGTP